LAQVHRNTHTCRQLLDATRVASSRTSALFELCVSNADKGSITQADVLQRLAPFNAGGLPVVLTKATLFTDKASLFRGAVFAVGFDTAVRILDPKYYCASETKMALELSRIQGAGCCFLVAGRRAGDGVFRTLRDIPVPAMVQQMGLFQEIPEGDFRADISSTQLRTRHSQPRPVATSDTSSPEPSSERD
jgi:hypothetical protein